MDGGGRSTELGDVVEAEAGAQFTASVTGAHVQQMLATDMSPTASPLTHEPLPPACCRSRTSSTRSRAALAGSPGRDSHLQFLIVTPFSPPLRKPTHGNLCGKSVTRNMSLGCGIRLIDKARLYVQHARLGSALAAGPDMPVRDAKDVQLVLSKHLPPIHIRTPTSVECMCQRGQHVCPVCAPTQVTPHMGLLFA